MEEDHGVLPGQGPGGLKLPVAALGDALVFGRGDGVGVIAVHRHVVKAVPAGLGQVEGPVEHQNKVSPGHKAGRVVPAVAGAGGDAVLRQKIRRGRRPAVLAHIAEPGGDSRGGDGDLHRPLVLIAGGIGAGVIEGEGALIAVFGDKGHPADGVAAGKAVRGAGGDQAAVAGGAGIVIIQLAPAGIGQGELHRGQAGAAPGVKGIGKIVGLEPNRGDPRGIPDGAGVLAGDHLDGHRAGDAPLIGVPAGKLDLHRAGGPVGGDKGDVLQVGAAAAVIVRGGGDLLVIAAVLGVVLIIEGPLAAAGQGEVHVVQAVPGLPLAPVVEGPIVEGDALPGGDGVVHISRLLPYGDLDGAGDGVFVRVPAGEGDGNDPGIVLGRDKGDVGQIGAFPPVIAGGAGDLFLPAGAVVQIEDPPVGGGQGELHIVQAVPRDLLASAVEVTGVKLHRLVRVRGVGDLGLLLGDRDDHLAGNAAAVAVHGGIGDVHRSGVVALRHEGDVGQVPAAAAVIAGGGGHLTVVVSGGGVVVVVKDTPAGGGEGKADVVQAVSGGVGDRRIEMVGVEGHGDPGGGGIGHVGQGGVDDGDGACQIGIGLSVHLGGNGDGGPAHAPGREGDGVVIRGGGTGQSNNGGVAALPAHCVGGSTGDAAYGQTGSLARGHGKVGLAEREAHIDDVDPALRSPGVFPGPHGGRDGAETSHLRVGGHTDRHRGTGSVHGSKGGITAQPGNGLTRRGDIGCEGSRTSDTHVDSAAAQADGGGSVRLHSDGAGSGLSVIIGDSGDSSRAHTYGGDLAVLHRGHILLGAGPFDCLIGSVLRGHRGGQSLRSTHFQG